MTKEYLIKKKSIEAKKGTWKYDQKCQATCLGCLLVPYKKIPGGLSYRVVLGKLRRFSPSLTEILDSDVLKEIIGKLFPDNDNSRDTLVNINDKAKEKCKYK